MSYFAEAALTGSLPVGTGQVNVVLPPASPERFQPPVWVDMGGNGPPPGVPQKYLKFNVPGTQLVPMTVPERDSVDALRAAQATAALAGAPKYAQIFPNIAAAPAPTPETEGAMVGLLDAGAGVPGQAMIIGGAWVVLSS